MPIARASFTLALLVFSVSAQPANDSDPPQDTGGRFWLSGQANFITQAHGRFRAPYSGDNSLLPEPERKTSRVLTLFTGLRLGKRTDLLFDVETSGGRGISDALGLAGFTNLDVVRNPSLGSKPYVARIMLHHVIPLSSDMVQAERGAFQLATALPARRLEIRAGKMGVVDFFDANGIAGDSHLQFMNWTVDNNGGYDYAADTRGYTYALMIEYQDRRWGLRFAEALMPTVANGIKVDWDLARARAENVELELRRSLIRGRQGVLRPLVYVNHANMGSYREAIDAFLVHREETPDVTAHRRQGRVKYGFGLNAEQELSKNVRAFGRFGWNEGSNESFAYTEVNQHFSGGSDLRGERWKRQDDKFGGALAVNQISGDHRRYLALGGQGFLLGDGALRYGRERIFEIYYNAKIWRGVHAAFDLQRVWNPGYNQDRGPVLVPGVRLHIDINSAGGPFKN